MRKVEATVARQEFSDTLNEVAFGHDRVILSRHGKDVAALVPMSDIDLLKRCEDLEKKPKTATAKDRGHRVPQGRSRGSRYPK